MNLDFFDRIFTGHFHVPSDNDKDKLIYVGTLLNKKFNESGKKGCWILNTKKNTLKFIENPNSPAFITVTDTNLLLSTETLETNAYYRVQCSPENVMAVTKMLSAVKGFEIISKVVDNHQASVSLEAVEKKNSSSLKDYILENCKLFMPDGCTEDEFKSHGSNFLGSM